MFSKKAEPPGKAGEVAGGFDRTAPKCGNPGLFSFPLNDKINFTTHPSNVNQKNQNYLDFFLTGIAHQFPFIRFNWYLMALVLVFAFNSFPFF